MGFLFLFIKAIVVEKKFLIQRLTKLAEEYYDVNSVS